MIRLAAAVAALALVATPVAATEWVHCSDYGGEASFDYLPGDGTGVLSISGLTVTAGERVWATDAANGPGDPVLVGQQFEDATTILVDAMDKDFVKIAELRLFKASEGADSVSSGTLRIPGMGAWAVSCDPS